ncbi:MAG: hypothetical protein KBC63_04770 [Candidatus Levybacteria bacterium]|nr:hypothetical protein [Candidatus Levybacteria bacterium]
MNYVNRLLNRLTMYQLVFYGLAILSAYSLALSFFGFVSYTILSLIISLCIVFVSCFITNFLFAKMLHITPNKESYIITALILFLVLIPPVNIREYFLLSLVSIIAISSKYILTIKKQHLLNPAAVGLVVGSFFGAGAIWWIGSSWFLIPVLILGILILKKVRKIKMFSVFFIFAILSLFIFGYFKENPLDSFILLFTSWPLLFLGLVMLTEPATTPTTLKTQSVYAGIVGFLSGVLYPLGIFTMTPEMALIAGNVYSYIVRPKYRLDLETKNIYKLSEDLYELAFDKPKGFTFTPGQYMEWTAPHKSMDVRGNRRYFSLASSPTENTIQIAFRMYEKASSFKRSIVEKTLKGNLIASHLSGDFILPKKLENPLAFIAGGIGVTPFRSMVKYLTDKNLQSDIVLLYLVKREEDLIFQDVFKEAEKIGVKVIPVIGSYHITRNDIEKNIPDAKERTFYISGPQPMVEGITSVLRSLKVKSIKTDFFPGYEV